MKILFLKGGDGCIFSFAIFVAIVGEHSVRGQTLTTSPVSVAPTAYKVVDRGLDYRVWRGVTYHTNEELVVLTNNQQYTELATGMSYMEGGKLLDSVEEIDPIAGGFQAAQGRHKVQWTANANTPNGAVTLTLPDNSQQVSTVYGLAYWDQSSGSNVLIAPLQDSAGTLVASNTLLYPSAFQGVSADLEYIYTRAGLAQNVLLKEIPSPASYGLIPESTVLQVITAFLSGPEPEKTTLHRGRENFDDVLSFGSMQIAVGQAVSVQGSGGSASAGTVGKHWLQTNGINYLLEEIPYSAVSNMLPAHASTMRPGYGPVWRTAAVSPSSLKPPGSMPSRVEVAADVSRRTLRTPSGRPRINTALAARLANQHYVRMDYEMLNGTTNAIFQGDQTYYISGPVALTNATTFEGGAVIKFNSSGSGASINFSSGTNTSVNWIAANYCPVLFTAKDYDYIGAVISGSTGTPSGYYANPALSFNLVNPAVSHFRVQYAEVAIQVNADINFTDGQIVNSATGVSASSGIVNLYNVLFANTPTALLDTGTSSSMEWNAINTTFAGSTNAAAVLLQCNHGGLGAGALTNCILANLSQFVSGAAAGFTNGYCGFYSNAQASFGSPTVTASANPFETAGEGGYYLNPANASSFTNAGTASIPSALLADIQFKTVYAPNTNLWGATVAANITLSNQVPRDVGGAPALGYHYDALDYALNLIITNSTLTILPGTAIAMAGTTTGGGYGVTLKSGASVNCEGTANNLSYLTRYTTVQEQSNPSWDAWWLAFFEPKAGSPSSVNLQFTELTELNSENYFYGFSSDNLPFSLENCQVYNGAFYTYSAGISATNCLFRRPMLMLAESSGTTTTHNFYNDLFYYGQITNYHTNSNPWTFNDNLFDHTIIANGPSAPSEANCAYITNCNMLTSGAGAHDQILTNSPNYQVGAMGQFYYPVTQTGLIHTGSRFASTAGLDQYTVTIDYGVDGTNMVSIGFHYVTAPSITQQPQTQTILDGSNVTFTVAAGGTTPLSYQWQFNGGNISGATTNALTINPVTLSSAGNYTVVVTNIYGAVTSEVATLTVYDLPSISPQPVNTTVVSGNSASFSVGASGTAPLSYQWYFNGAALPGAVSSILTINPAAPSDAGTYDVVVSNPYGTATSGSATLTVYVPASIITQPTNTTVVSGYPATFSVTATGTTPLAYQWYFNGGALSGATSSAFTITNAAITNAGSYDVIVTNLYGAATSAVATLTVNTNVAPSITSQPASTTVVSGNTANFSVTATGTLPLYYQWYFNGGLLSSATSSGLSITNATQTNAGSYDVVITNLYGAATSVVVTLTMTAAPVPGYYAWWNPNTLSTAPGTWTDSSSNGFALTATGGATPILSTVNSNNVLSFNPGAVNFTNFLTFSSGFAPNLSNCVIFLALQPAAYMTNHVSHVLIDSIAGGWIFNNAYNNDGASQYELRPGSVDPEGSSNYGKDEVITNWQIFAATFNMSNTCDACWTNGSIAFSNSSATCINHTLTYVYFGASYGSGTADYSGYLGDILVYTNQPNISGLVRSNTLYLGAKYAIPGIPTPPYITSQPTNTSVISGNSAKFYVTAAGTSPLYYQWYFAGGAISGGTSNVLTLTSATSANAGNYDVVVTNSYGAATSVVATLTVNVPPSITSGPSNAAVIVGNSTNFSVTAAGTSPLYYQWYFAGGAISGGTSNVLAITSATSANAGNYNVVVTNSFGSATSAVATLTVNVPASVTTQPANATVIAGNSTNFSVTAAGTAPLYYQWYFGGAAISAGTSNVLTITSATSGNAGNYDVVVSNSFGVATSLFATLTVNVPALITTQPANAIVISGSSTNFSVTATGTTPLYYQWYFNGGVITNATSTTFAITNAVPSNAGSYDVVVTNVAGATTSSIALLAVVAPPVITQEPTNQTIAVGGTAVFHIGISSVVPCSYQWQFNGTNLSNNIIFTIAGNGSNAYFGDGGLATNASIYAPYGAAVDTFGNLYVADLGNYRIRRIDINGIITTFAGSGIPGYYGDGGQATNARFSDPYSVAIDPSGNVLIADLGNNRIRKVGANGIITTVAGNGSPGYSGDGGLATSASLNDPSGVAVDGLGTLFIADLGNGRIRKVDTNGIIITVAGNGSNAYFGDGGPATNASLNGPYAVALDALSNFFIADSGNNRVRKVTTNGIITTFAGNGSAGNSGGAATNATLDEPYNVAVDGSGNVFIANLGNNEIREVGTNGIIATVAGTGSSGGYSGDGGPGTNATLDEPYGVGVDGVGNLFIADTANNRVREVALAGSATLTLVGVTANQAGTYTVIVTNFVGSVTSSIATLTVLLPPSITSQPANATVIAGNSTNFSVTATGTAPLYYQWYFDGGSISGATSNVLTINSATSGNAGSYDVVVTNLYGAVTSTVATLTVHIPPAIISQPTNLAVAAGVSATFAVTATNGSLSYQWKFNGTSISGATTSSWTASSPQSTNAGSYFVVITNNFAAVTSLTATLAIAPSVESTCSTNGPDVLGRWSFDSGAWNWWPGDNNTNDVAGTNNAAIQGDVTYIAGEFNDAFAFGGSGAYLILGTNAGNFGTNDFSIDFWLNTTSSGQAQAILSKGLAAGPNNYWGIRLTAIGGVNVQVCQDSSGTYYQGFTSQKIINDGAWHEITLTRQNTNFFLYIDSQFDTASAANGMINFANPSNLWAGRSGNSSDYYFVGALDEIRLMPAVGWTGSAGQLPLSIYNVQDLPSLWTNGVQLDTTIPGNIAYRYIEQNGSENIHAVNGAVRFWFKPDWNGGTGPGNPGRLLEMGDATATDSTGWWSLGVDSTGSNLSFQSKSNGVLMTYFTESIASWSAGAWHEIVLDYSLSQTSLYVDGVLVQEGTGMTYYPSVTGRITYGFSVGSDHTGQNEARGTFDELMTFDCPLSSAEVAVDYAENISSTTNYVQWVQGRNPTNPGSVPDTNGLVNLQVYTPLQ